jgi:hypothetical protein
MVICLPQCAGSSTTCTRADWTGDRRNWRPTATPMSELNDSRTGNPTPKTNAQCFLRCWSVYLTSKGSRNGVSPSSSDSPSHERSTRMCREEPDTSRGISIRVIGWSLDFASKLMIDPLDRIMDLAGCLPHAFFGFMT